jgi:hypothetical protein
VDGITALRDVFTRHQGRAGTELMALRTMLADLETDLDKRSGNRAR